MTAMMFLGMAAMDVYLPALPQMVEYFATTPKVINLTLSCYTFGIAIGVLFIGELSSRYGRYKTLLISMITFALTSFVIAITNSISIVIFCRLIQSICAATTIVVSRLVLKDCLDMHEQLKANGLLVMGLVISPAIAPIIGAYLTEHYHWQSTFVLLGVISLILAWLTYRYIPETNYNIQTAFWHLGYYLNIYKRLLSNLHYLCTVFISSCTTATYFSFLGISSYLFILHWGFTPEKYSLLFLLTAASYLAGNFAMQLLNYLKFSINKIVAYGLGITVIGTLIMAISPIFPIHITIIFIVVGAFLMRMANALINPPTQITVINQFGTNNSQAIGLHFSIGFCLNALAISGVTFFVHTPLMGLILVSGILTLIAVISHYFTTIFRIHSIHGK